MLTNNRFHCPTSLNINRETTNSSSLIVGRQEEQQTEVEANNVIFKYVFIQNDAAMQVAAQQFMLNGYAAARTPFAIQELLGLVATNCDPLTANQIQNSSSSTTSATSSCFLPFPSTTSSSLYCQSSAFIDQQQALFQGLELMPGMQEFNGAVDYAAGCLLLGGGGGGNVGGEENCNFFKKLFILINLTTSLLLSSAGYGSGS
ncbi:unnamed protein product [Meloidogyne enterolobii]|uniref:Uncharacterized protein n=1 Tax=Meloidogyne enterolobii TaxID=390850 RepID=A0ACB0YTB9_MELEN